MQSSEHTFQPSNQLKQDIINGVSLALAEDLSTGTDITAELIPQLEIANATVITREECIICGVDWVNEVFAQLDKAIAEQYKANNNEGAFVPTTITWFVNDGQHVSANTTLYELSGFARTLLTGERTALNFLQTLSGTATVTSEYVKALKGSTTKLLDTRKTIPGLRNAQKYAVTCGGGFNHRIGLFDAFLIKENHIAACGGINKAILKAKQNHPDKKVEVEVESINELNQALNAQADIIMLDNFTHEMIEQGIELRDKTNKEQNYTTKIEVSGNMTLNTLASYAKPGVDFISVGALTKHVNVIDLSMRFS
jgi:nicotinate-nucleotide pyrophosphorylase (carboxylating)